MTEEGVYAVPNRAKQKGGREERREWEWVTLLIVLLSYNTPARLFALTVLIFSPRHSNFPPHLLPPSLAAPSITLQSPSNPSL